MKIFKVIGGVVLVAALIAGLVLVRNNQETRRGAFFAKVGVSILPDSKEIKVGESLTAKVKINAESQRVSGVNLKINYNSSVVEVVSVKMNQAVFATIPKQEAAGGVVELIGLSTKTSGELPTGVFDVATLVLKGKNNGTANLNFASDYEISGWNSSGGVDKQLEASFSGASYKVGTGSGGGGGVEFYLTPSEKNLVLGEGTVIEAKLKTGEKRISAVNMKLKYDPTRLTVTDLVKSSVFDSAPILSVNQTLGEINFSLLSMKTSNQLPKGDISLVTFVIKGKAMGTSNISLNSNYELVSSSGVVSLGKIGGGSYVVTGGVTVVPPPKYFAMADFEFRPASGTVTVGGQTKLAMWLKSGTTKISGIQIRTLFDKNKVKVGGVAVPEVWSALASVADNTKGELNLSLVSMKASSQLPTGDIKLAEFEVTGLAEGIVEFTVADGYEVAGYNPSGTGGSVGLGSVGKAVVTVATAGGGVSTGETVLNFKMAFGKLAGDAKCVTNWPVQVTVLGGGMSKIYPGVTVERDTSVTDKAVFKGTLTLTGFPSASLGPVAVFIKGPKHLQMKYGINNQTGVYGKAGGEITLTDSAATSPWYDFSGFPLLPGDISGESGTQDGWVNGLDFSKVKQKSLTHETVETGGYILEDLDGNCQVNSNDVTVLKISLNEKQESLY